MAFFLAIVFAIIGAVLINTPNGQPSVKEYKRKYPDEDAPHEFLLQTAIACEYHRRGLYPGKERVMAIKNARLRILDLGLRPYNFDNARREYPDMKTFNRDSSALLFEPGPIGNFTTHDWGKATSSISQLGRSQHEGYVLCLTFNRLSRDFIKEFPIARDDMREVRDLGNALPDGFLNPDGTIQFDRLEALADTLYQEIIAEANDVINKTEAEKADKDTPIAQVAPTPERAHQQLKEKYGIDYPEKQ